MEQAPWKGRSSAVEKTALQEESTQAPSELDQDRQEHLDRLRAEIAAGNYRVPAESIAEKLVRRFRWW